MNVTPLKPPNGTGGGPIPSLSIETGRLVEYVSARRQSTQTITDGELSGVVGGPIQGNRYRGYLSSAKRILFRDQHILLERVRGIGYRVADNAGVVQAMVRDVGSSRRALGRARRKGEAVDETMLTDHDRGVFHGHVAAINVLRLMSRPSAIRKVSAQSVERPITAAAVLDLFK